MTKLTNPKTHVVREGETLFIIAEQYGLTLEALIEANPGINPRLITVGQEINIPNQNNEGNSSKTHIVKEGENLSIIAEQYEVTLVALIEANPGINPRLIVVGQGINIPDQNNGGDSSKTHIVKEGESLYTIAEQYGVTLNALIEANPEINPNLLVVGQRINIPD